MKSFKLSFIALVCILTLANCGKDDNTTAEEQSLYERLGSDRSLIRKVVAKSINPIISTNSLKPYFQVIIEEENQATVDALVDNLTDFIVEAAGGPADYNGKSMVDAHSESGNEGRYTDNGPITSEIYGDFVNAVMEGAKEHITDANLLTDFEALLNSLEIVFVNN